MKTRIIVSFLLVLTIALLAVGCTVKVNQNATTNPQSTNQNNNGNNNNDNTEDVSNPTNEPGDDTVNVITDKEQLKSKYQSVSFEMVVISGGKETESVMVKSSPDGYLFLSKEGGGIANYAEKKYYLLDTEQKTAIATTIDDSQQQQDAYDYLLMSWGQMNKDDLKLYKKVGSENVDGINCDIYEFKLVGEDGVRMRIYVTSEGLGLKLVTVDKDNNITDGWYYKNFKTNSVQKSDFYPPSDYTITDLGDLTGEN